MYLAVIFDNYMVVISNIYVAIISHKYVAVISAKYSAGIYDGGVDYIFGHAILFLWKNIPVLLP